jgi:hypothetical protein
MAQKVLVHMVDDIDGGEADQSVTFALDGVQYEIDLSAANADALRSELGAYVAAARRTGGRKARSSGTAPAATPDRERTRMIRAWAVDNGYEISERGRLSSAIVEAFESAQTQAEPEVDDKAPRKRASRKKVAAA